LVVAPLVVAPLVVTPLLVLTIGDPYEVVKGLPAAVHVEALGQDAPACGVVVTCGVGTVLLADV